MSDAPSELGLLFLPDWLKEGPSKNPYADYQGDTGERGRGGRDGDRGGRSDSRGPRRDGPSGRGRPDARGPRRDGPPSGPRRDGPPSGPRRDGPGGRRPDRPNDRSRDARDEPREPAVRTAPVRIDFLPEPNGLAGITRQIKGGARAYPLFGTARLFLEKPERHRVRMTSQDATVPLFQCEGGPISFDRAAIEKGAFRMLREEYYREETVQGEPLKGNFSNVARSRSSGLLLGPTNYHGYQPALRKLYEERFSRRMSFPEFQQNDIQVVSDEQAIADWKESARSTTTYITLKEAEPLTFKTVFETEQHFRKEYLPKLLRTGVTLETSGPASRASMDRSIGNALREAWEQEKQFPQNLVNLLRPAFQEAGLHYFKHRKRMLFVSPIRPQRAPKGQVFSENFNAILATIEAVARCTRRDLAMRILGDQAELPEAAPRKAALAGDLHYLIQAGHVLEFHDGTLDLPLAPGEKPEQEKTLRPMPQTPASAAATAVTSEAPAVEAVEVEPEAGAEVAAPAETNVLSEPAEHSP